MQLDPVNAGGLRRECTQFALRKWRSTKANTPVGAPSLDRDLDWIHPGLWQAIHVDLRHQPRIPAIRKPAHLRFKTKASSAQLHVFDSRTDRDQTHDAAVLGGGPPSLIAPQPHPPTGMFELEFAPVVRGWRQRRRLDERQEFSRIQTRHTRAPAAGTHCRRRMVAPTNSAEAICLSHVRSNSGALAVSEYTILGAAPN